MFQEKLVKWYTAEERTVKLFGDWGRQYNNDDPMIVPGQNHLWAVFNKTRKLVYYVLFKLPIKIRIKIIC